jgi:two-component system CheB/CheR fusion protein
MVKKRSSDRRPSKDVKKALPLKKGPTDGKGAKSAGPAKSFSKRLTSPAIESQPAEQDRSKEKTFLIVGIGASAGGLEAFTMLLKKIPPHTGMAFVLVQHLAPTKDSILTDLLSKATSLPVHEVQDGMTIEPDHVYVIPPNAFMTVFHGVLRLSPRADSPAQHMPIDSFFRSLAEDQGQSAVGIILSGTGSDGSLGIKAIKAEGGIILAQDGSAKYDGMPKSAVATGSVDYVLPPEKMAAELARISRHPFMNLHTNMKTSPPLQAGEDDLSKIFMRIRTATGVDFTYYKQATVLRRIHRRMLLHKIDALGQYARYLQEDTKEAGVLYQDILINVTSFFRDPETFSALKNVVFPRFIEKRASDTPLRVWVPGCSTGEEAYSLAMCFAEFSEERGVSHPIQFFASDIDEAAIEKARQGLYPDTIAQDVSPERIRRFFVKTEHGYHVSKPIRDLCIFARQNLIKDPPFAKMDLISCRNLMIYFGPVLQKKALPILHYALNPSGYLMLGRSESIGEFANLFSLVDKNSRIYSKKTSSTELHFDADLGPVRERADVKIKREELAAGGPDSQKEADSIILNRYSPAGLVINENMDILQFRGNISPYLRPQPGKASLNLMKMAGESLAMELRVLIRQASGKDAAVRKEGIKVRHNGIVSTINIEVIAFKTRDSQERLFLVIFEDRAATGTAGPAMREKVQAMKKNRSQEDQVAPLAHELAATQQHLKTIVAEHEASTEELKALNEEVQSSNEELQSINEELETSKEELQSTNEELSTVNDELQNRNEEITQSNNDLVNVLSGVDIPILLIGNKLQVRRFNASAGKALNLIATDIGRPISDIRPNINVPDLDRLILEVVDSLKIKEQEVQDTQGRWYSMSIRPYKTVDNRIDGAIVTFEDIDGLKLGMLRIQEARDYAEAIVETVREHLIVLSKDLRVVTANQAYYKNFAVKPEAIKNKYFYDIQDGLWNMPKLRQLLEEIITENSVFNDFEVDYEAPGAGRRFMLLNARRVAREEQLILLAVEDITARRMAEEERDKIDLDRKEALSKVKKLAGMLPICSSCKKIRNDEGYWEQIEAYVRGHSEAEFSHSLCPDCAVKLYPEYAKELNKGK